MGYAVELYFDQYSEGEIKSIWKRLYDERLHKFMHDSNSRPHISLAVYNDDVDEKKLVRRVEIFSKSMDPFKLRLSNIGMFHTDGTVIFLSPKITPELLDLHNRYHGFMKDFAEEEWAYYLPQSWIPHCTMATGLGESEMHGTLDVIREMFAPMEVVVEEVGVVHFQPIEYVEVFSLY